MSTKLTEIRLIKLCSLSNSGTVRKTDFETTVMHGDEEVLPMQDYGGFITLTMLKQTEQPIRCAATLAPIVDWSLYGKLGEVVGVKDPVTVIQLEVPFRSRRSPL